MIGLKDAEADSRERDLETSVGVLCGNNGARARLSVLDRRSRGLDDVVLSPFKVRVEVHR